MLRDSDIRESLHRHLAEEFRHDADTWVVDEMVVRQGDARVDIAVLNGSFYGYEIKSERDTLERLPRQAEAYNAVFDFVTLVCSEKFEDKLEGLIPDWWGICLALPSQGSAKIITKRAPKPNHQVEAYALLQFLRRDEVEQLLLMSGAHKRDLRRPKYMLWELATQVCPLADIKDYVRESLKVREGWRADRLHG